MIRLFQILLLGHFHKWKIIKEGPFETWGDTRSDVVRKQTYYNLQCEKCGIVKRKIL